MKPLNSGHNWVSAFCRLFCTECVSFVGRFVLYSCPLGSSKLMTWFMDYFHLKLGR